MSDGFVSLFVAIVDWIDGDDSQYWTLVPLTPAEIDALTRLGEGVTEATVRSLASNSRCLQRDYPKGESPRVHWDGT